MPIRIKSFLRQIKQLGLLFYYSLIDLLESIFGLRDTLTPPRRLIFVGEGDFKKTGQEFLNYFVEIVKLEPSARVLDVGCGIGRMAVPLTNYLADGGSYHGFDIVPAGIKWCQEKISPRYPNFKFLLADISNDRYNPMGRFRAREYKFPFADESFDFVFLTSVFTHMLPEDMENYVSEISRVMKKEGKVLLTFFLLNEESIKNIHGKQSSLKFSYNRGDYSVEFDDLHEAAVSYNEAYVINLLSKYNLNVNTPVHYGSWCGRSNFLSYQDIIIGTRA